MKDILAGGESLTVWPYTTSDFENPSDPINLIFPNADPRAIRQVLMKLDGARPPVAALPGGNCRWTDVPCGTGASVAMESVSGYLPLR